MKTLSQMSQKELIQYQEGVKVVFRKNYFIGVAHGVLGVTILFLCINLFW